MADSYRDPRSSTDHENAPLLRDPESDRNEEYEPQPESFTERLASLVQEPLTPLSKVLLVVVLVLLLSSSIFIGLFAGAQHKLNTGKGKDDVPIPAETVTVTTTTVHTTTVSPAPAPTSPPEEKVCTSPECIVLSASILSSLDTTQDPCDNFYEYSNGGWLKAHPLPADKGVFGTFEQLAQHNMQIIQDILDPSSTSLDMASLPSFDQQLLAKLRGLYSSCLNETKLDEVGTAPLLDFVRTLRKLYSGDGTDVSTQLSNDGLQAVMKARNSNVRKEKGLTEAIAFLHSRGVDALFTFVLDGDVGVDPNLMTLWFNQPNLGLPSKEYYEEASVLEVYQEVIERILLSLFEEEDARLSESAGSKATVWPSWPWPPWGDDDEDKTKPNNTEKAHKLAEHVVELESGIAEASLDLDILYQDVIGTYNPISFTNLSSTLPQIHFPTYFSTFAPRVFPSRLISTYPTYALSLSDILEATSADVVEAYLIVRASLTLAPYLGTSTEVWQAHRRLVEMLSGLKKGSVGDRGEFCATTVENALGFASGRYFVNQTFNGESKAKGTKVITDIVQAFKASLPNLKWMDEESAKAAAQKADAIRVKVGYPVSPDTMDARSIANYYSSVIIRDDDFFHNILSSFVSEEIKKWRRLGSKRDPDAWEMYPSTVNAYFNPPANEIVFPAGILQPPFFSKDWPAYLSYGAFGQVAAHELTHAFDSAGRMYNQEGKLEQWWTNITSENYQAKQDCIVKQYSNYTVDDGKGHKIHVNGNLTAGENIGDSGLIQAYRAWKVQYDSSFTAGNEYNLPGLNFTREQLFFIAFGQEWARKMKPAAAVQRVRTDPHSPNKYRVEGTVSNIPEFAKAFSCSVYSKLNPPAEKRCILW